MRVPPKRIGLISTGQTPASKTLISPVMADKSSGPISVQLTRSERCWGRRPSGPPEEPIGKERIRPKTCSSDVWKAAVVRFVVIEGRSGGGTGCFVRNSSIVSGSAFTGLSVEQRILTAALFFPSSRFDATAAVINRSFSDLDLSFRLTMRGFAEKISSLLSCQVVRKISTRFLMVDVRL